MEEQIKPNEEISSMLKRMYEGKFTEQQMKLSSIIGQTLGEISHDDQQFLKLMDQETIKVDGYYVVSLLLKSKDFNLPNNRVLALKRLNYLQRKQTWCISHHGVAGFKFAIRNMQFAKHFGSLQMSFCIFSKNCKSLKSHTS